VQQRPHVQFFGLPLKVAAEPKGIPQRFPRAPQFHKKPFIYSMLHANGRCNVAKFRTIVS